MSSRKKDDKKSKKNDKDKEKQRMEMEERQRQQERQEAQKRIQVLQKSGILDAYEYFLRAICKNGLPEANIFEFAAQQILKYQKKMKQQQSKKQELKNFNRSMAESPSHKKLQKSGEKLKPQELEKSDGGKGTKKK